jgi:hypothetical protein
MYAFSWITAGIIYGRRYDGGLGRNYSLSQSFSAVPGDVPQVKGYILQEPPYDELSWLGLYALKQFQPRLWLTKVKAGLIHLLPPQSRVPNPQPGWSLLHRQSSLKLLGY